MDIIGAKRTGLVLSGGRVDQDAQLSCSDDRSYKLLLRLRLPCAHPGRGADPAEGGITVTIVTYQNGGPVAGLTIRRTLPIPWRQNYEVGSSRHKIGFDVLLGLKTLELLARQQVRRHSRSPA